MKYSPKDIEPKWQKYWEESGINRVDLDNAKKPFYNLMMFPYPSAEGLHVGNMYAFTHSDAFGRFMKLKGFDVFEPIGLDGFGIHSENYAIKIKEHIKDVSKRTEKHFYEQLHIIGNQYDWSRKVETYKPEYYKWTQWLFLQMYKKGLAYRANAPVNWCPSCKTVLSDEQIVSAQCERCGTQTEKRQMEQWFFKITDYAEKLLKNLDSLDWPQDVKTIQRNWIGKSEGARIKFPICHCEESEGRRSNPVGNDNNSGSPRPDGARDDGGFIEVFTTRPDTIFGATFLVMCPEHQLIHDFKDKIKNIKEIEEYIVKAKQKSSLERTDLNKDKTGIEVKGIKAINPATKKEIPIFTADHVLNEYGTGAIMAVPAHDERDFEFAKKYNLPIQAVIASSERAKQSRSDAANREIASSQAPRNDDTLEVFTEFGVLVNSGEFSGLTSQEATKKINEWLEKNNLGKAAVNYRLRDWCVSRQRYWGPPIPIVYCLNPDCHSRSASVIPAQAGIQVNSESNSGLDPRFHGDDIEMLGMTENRTAIIDGKEYAIVPVPEKDLPVVLPEMEDFLPDGSGKGPLNKNEEFVNTTCSQCGGPAKRETDVSDPFVDSCWYYLHYISTDFNDKPFDKDRLAKWMPVNMYIGGKEHAVLHLLYSRFISMVMKDLGYLKEEEPFKRFFAHGLLIRDGSKMSKSKGNVINPDEYIKKFGADSVRSYLMFMGDARIGGDWRDEGMNGIYRFMNRVWNISESIIEKGIKKTADENILKSAHKAIKRVGDDLERLKFNTAISAIMEYVNALYASASPSTGLGSNEKEIGVDAVAILAQLIAPFAPHLAEEIWAQCGKSPSIFQNGWPEYDEKLIKEEQIEIPVQINGKMRGKILASPEISQKEAVDLALKGESIKKWLEGKEPKKVIFVAGKLINIVV